MRPESLAKNLAGVLALAAMLALSSPGVRVARAGDGDAAPSDPPAVGVAEAHTAGACRVGEEPKPRADRSAVAALIAERLRAELQRGDEKPVVLNGRGYNYKTTRDPQRELQIVEMEAARQRERAAASR